MSRKDYKALAAALASTKPCDDTQGSMLQWKRDVLEIASALAGDNYLFQKATFLAACGYEGD